MKDGKALCTVQWGGYAKHPHVTMTGFNTRAFVGPFRDAYPVHRVTRVDSALDMRADGLFESLWQVFDAIVARDSRMHSTADRQMPPIGTRAGPILWAAPRAHGSANCTRRARRGSPGRKRKRGGCTGTW